MAREFAKSFYSGKAWQDCRNSYAKEKRYLCENCLRCGIITPGEIVHHIIEIDQKTINNPEVALSFDNLELLCRKCHADQHKMPRKGRRYIIDEYGKVFAAEEKEK